MERMLELSNGVRDAILAHARDGYPHEVCGVLLGRAHGLERRQATDVFATANVDASRDRFRIDPREVLEADTLARERGLELVGFYHSHPDAPARASATDLELTSPWGGFSYPIVSVHRGEVAELRSWKRESDRWVEESVRLTETKA
jgi:proteasome lid subunit RPN8/RPN11